MDEPLGALDKKLRDQMQLEIKRIHRELGTTIVYVTHDQEEAMTMSDRICLMNDGRIEQLGSPDDLYFRPRTLFVADFLGESNLLPARVSEVAADALDVVLGGGRRACAREQQWQRLQQGPERQGDGAPAERRGRAARMETSDKLVGRLTDIMVSGSLTKLYMDARDAGHAAAGRRLSDARRRGPSRDRRARGARLAAVRCRRHRR